jgi:hypothetical protein
MNDPGAAAQLARRAIPPGMKPGFNCHGLPAGRLCMNDKGKRKQARRGYDSKQAFFCKPCADEFCVGFLPMFDVKSPICVCGEHRPTFGMIDDPRPTRCKKCKLDGMEDITHMKCVCSKHIPSFGMIGDPRPTRCKECKLDGMKEIVSLKCVCGKHQPSFGSICDLRPTRCKECKLDGMKNIKSLKCVCGKHQPIFGILGDPRPTRCTECKLDGMKDIVSQMCACGKHRPTFGMLGDPRPTRCKECKMDGMNDISNQECLCGKHQPNFGMPGDSRPTRCSDCKIEGMEDIKTPKCATENCSSRINFAWKPYCAACYAEIHPGDPLVQAHNKTEAKLKGFFNNSLDAGISALSTFNAMNVRGKRAPAWMRPYEFDFVILGERGVVHCDGAQHKSDVTFWKSSVADEIANDRNKSMIVLEHGLFEVRIDQVDVWKDRCDWRSLLTGILAFGVTRKLAGEATCVVGRRDEADLSYGPYVDAMLQTPHAERVYEAFLTPNERDILTVIHRASGARTHWRIPLDFKLARWSETNPSTAPAVPTQQTIVRAFQRRKLL